MKQGNMFSYKSLFSHRSLRIQLLFRSLAILAALLTLIGLFQYALMRDFVYKNKASSIQGQIMAVPADTWLQLIADGGRNGLHRELVFIPGSNLAFIGLEGGYTFLSDGPENLNPPKLDQDFYMELLKERPGLNYKVVVNEGVQQLLVFHPIMKRSEERPVGLIQIGASTGPLKDLLMRQLLIFLLLSLTAMFFGLLTFLPVLRRTLVPLSNMIRTAEQIDAGNLARRFPGNQGQLEIDRLSESFNGMLERLETSFAAEKRAKEKMGRFIADASHELRTPLTSIQGFLDILLRGAAGQPAQLDKSLKSMRDESERLNKLVQDLIVLAKLEQEPSLNLREGMLDTVIWEMEAQLTILAGYRKVNWIIEPNMACTYDKDKIKQVILNLFQNAVQHTDPEKGRIWISMTKKGNGVLFSVEDNGPGIQDIHLPHIFDRFYRSDSSRTRKYGGAGLGLSITKSILDAHQGTIQVISEPGKGSIFQVWIPRQFQGDKLCKETLIEAGADYCSKPQEY